MNPKRFALACVAVYLTYQFLSILIHQVLLAETYGALASVFRPEAELVSKAWISLVSSAVMVVLFCYLYTRLEHRPGRLQGLLYGVLIGALAGVSMAYESYMIYPISLVAGQRLVRLVPGRHRDLRHGLGAGISSGPSSGDHLIR